SLLRTSLLKTTPTTSHTLSLHDALPIYQAEEKLLQARRDRAALAASDLDAVHRAHWRDLRRGACEEQFVCDVQLLARDVLLADEIGRASCRERVWRWGGGG